jgi:hypothetical protein
MTNRRKKASAEAAREAASGVGQATNEHVDRPAIEEIRVRAYEIFLERGGGEGDDVGDWLRAENEYRRRHQATETRPD